MRRYLKNLIIALMGRNPYRMELDDLTEKYEKTAERVYGLNDIYFKMVEKMEETKMRMNDYQTLVENLRQRVAEKEVELDCQKKDFRDRMERIKSDYQKRLNACNRKIEELNDKCIRPDIEAVTRDGAKSV